MDQAIHGVNKDTKTFNLSNYSLTTQIVIINLFTAFIASAFLIIFNLITSLAKRPGVIKDRNQLMDAMYGDNIYVDDRTIDSHIKRLRKKFKLYDSTFDQIRTRYGSGYSWRE